MACLAGAYVVVAMIFAWFSRRVSRDGVGRETTAQAVVGNGIETPESLK